MHEPAVDVVESTVVRLDITRRNAKRAEHLGHHGVELSLAFDDDMSTRRGQPSSSGEPASP